jgi:hypothetical protein
VTIPISKKHAPDHRFLSINCIIARDRAPPRHNPERHDRHRFNDFVTQAEINQAILYTRGTGQQTRLDKFQERGPLRSLFGGVAVARPKRRTL